ncbi:hypothetical protein [Flavobacterium sp. N3904]|uniref:hypothetical protein n=1 Tax=Flavobacterium sp. N3904 TaxID=2986835 RepID=UPI0022252548|nr:hypothetical protein [Flavobacterium sp. N3904]
MKTTIKLLLLFVLASTSSFAQNPSIQQSIALIKQNFEASKISAKKYSWIETTTVFIDGNQKSVTQNQCYYDVTGTLIKVPTGATTQAETPGGIRGRIIANKKADIEDYIAKAKTQIKAYIPPQTSVLEQLYSAGAVGIKVLLPGQKFELDFPNYLKQGDLLAIQVDMVNKVLLEYNINTYMDTPSDAVTLNVNFQNLPDGTTYSGNIIFIAPSQKLKIVVTNSGYKLGSGQ